MALVQHVAALKPASMPVCSVCIANYNGVGFVDHCIESVLAQQGGLPVEIIVHDDASTDGSAEWIKQRYPQVQLLVSHTNVGFCVANNRMVAKASGKFVLLLNNDAALQPDALQTLLAAAHRHAPTGILTLPQYDWRTGELVDRGSLLDPFYNPVPNLDAGREGVAYVLGACLFLERSAWEDLGGLPEWMESMAEDMYLCCLARLRGLPVQVARESGYRHRQGATFGGNRVDAGRLKTTYRRRFLSERNKTAVMVVCTPGQFVWLLLAVHLLALALEGILLSLLKRDMRLWREIYAPALAHALLQRRMLLARRDGVQRTRRIGLRAYLRPFTLLPRKLVLLRRHGLPSVR